MNKIFLVVCNTNGDIKYGVDSSTYIMGAYSNKSIAIDRAAKLEKVAETYKGRCYLIQQIWGISNPDDFWYDFGRADGSFDFEVQEIALDTVQGFPIYLGGVCYME